MFLENVLCANNSLGRSINLLHAGEFPITCIYINPLQTEKKKEEKEGRRRKRRKRGKGGGRRRKGYLFLFVLGIEELLILRLERRLSS